MKRNVRIFAVLLCAALLLPGCHKTDDAAVAPANTVPASSQADSSQAPSSDAPSSQAASSEQTASQEARQSNASSQGGIVKTAGTDSKEFNEKFSKNPVDASYTKEIKKAIATADMEKVFDKYAGLWEKEIIHAYAALKKALPSDSAKWKQIEADQKAWESGKDAALKKIGDDAMAQGGTYARVQASSDGMEYYRSRAVQLYRQLYDCDKNYTYAFAA